MRLTLVMIVGMALLHKAGMFSGLGKSGSCSTSLACVWVYLLCWGSVVESVLVFGLESMCLTVCFSRVIRISYLVSDFVRGGV